MSLRRLVTVAAVAPFSRRAQSSRQDEDMSPLRGDGADGRDEGMTQPLLKNVGVVDLASPIREYGAVSHAGPSSESSQGSRRASPEVRRRESGLNRVPEELDADEAAAQEAEDAEWDLEERGLYPGAQV